MSDIATAMVVVVTTCVSVGAIVGASIAYPIGRRHGFDVALEHWKKMNELTKKPVRSSIAKEARRIIGDAENS
jgi:membrane protein DedA with SNARE-associated domain